MPLQGRGKLGAEPKLDNRPRYRVRRQKVEDAFRGIGNFLHVERRGSDHVDLRKFVHARQSVLSHKPYAQIFDSDVIIMTLEDLLELFPNHIPKPPMAERREKKANDYAEYVFLHLAGRPQLPRYSRVRTAKEIARECRLDLRGVKAALKKLMAEGKVVRDRCSFGDGYAVAYKE